MTNSRFSLLIAVLVACGGGTDKAASDPAPPESAPAAEYSGPTGDTLASDARAFDQIAPFVKMAASYGDRSTGAHGSFGIFPGGASSPPHTHGGNYHGVVIRGVIENPFGTEANPARLEAGSYWYVPAGAEHITRCVSAEPCEFYFHAGGKFDFAPVEAMATPRAAGAVALPGAELEWAEVAPFVKMAAAFGDRAGGAHGTFGRFPAGASSPIHTHSGAYRAIVISGIMTNPFNGDSAPPRLGPGSSWFVPGGAIHATACVSKEPCLFYFHADGKFDFSPVDPRP